jgi:3',5'-cyclic AMP phosphodiesterase CpdA
MTLSRREFLLTSSAAAAGLVVSSGVATGGPAPQGETALVFAHLTDMHIKPTGAGPEGLARCLRHAQAHPDNPKFIINGGDAIMSALGATAESTTAQWAQYHAIMAAELKLPIFNCLGNHDNWGIQRSKAGTTGDEPLYGNKWALKELGMERAYYTFDDGGWRFIVLDSVRDRGDGGYLPMLSDEQFAWFEQTLAATPNEMPIIVVSHVPILRVTGFFFSDEIVKDYQFRVPGALMQQDYQ